MSVLIIRWPKYEKKIKLYELYFLHTAIFNPALTRAAKEKFSELVEDIKEVVVEQLSVGADEVKEDAKFVEDLGADSLDVVELVMDLEEKFDIEIPDDEAEKIQTVQDVVTYIESK